MFNRSEVIVLTNKQTNRCPWKHPPCFAMQYAMPVDNKHYNKSQVSPTLITSGLETEKAHLYLYSSRGTQRAERQNTVRQRETR